MEVTKTDPKSSSQTCHPILVAFVWELTTNNPFAPGLPQGGLVKRNSVFLLFLPRIGHLRREIAGLRTRFRRQSRSWMRRTACRSHFRYGHGHSHFRDGREALAGTFFFFCITLKPGVEWYTKSMSLQQTSPPRNCRMFLSSTCSQVPRPGEGPLPESRGHDLTLTAVYAPRWTRARLGTAACFCQVLVLRYRVRAKDLYLKAEAMI